MRTQLFICRAGLIAFLVGSPFGFNAQTRPAQDDPAAPTITSLDNLDRLPTVEAFRLAYEVLGPGKRNYLGHRGGAMAEIEAAAKLLGADIGRKIQRAHDEQAKSDARLELAQKILLRMHERLGTEDLKPVVEHVDKALAELAKGLKIRAVEDGKE